MMTVSGEDDRPYNKVYCVWFSGDGTLRSNLFREGLLRKVIEDSAFKRKEAS
jgi:hypothetical protein